MVLQCNAINVGIDDDIDINIVYCFVPVNIFHPFPWAIADIDSSLLSAMVFQSRECPLSCAGDRILVENGVAYPNRNSSGIYYSSNEHSVCYTKWFAGRSTVWEHVYY